MSHALLAGEGAVDPGPASLLERFRSVRTATLRLCAPLETEDYVAQSLPDASPVKWHLAHTSWFFETVVIKPNSADGVGVSPQAYAFLFGVLDDNSIGGRVAWARRGLLTRPTLAEVIHYRAAVDARVTELIERAGASTLAELASRVELGLHHEQRHQELLLADVKHLFGSNPLRPAYREYTPPLDDLLPAVRWIDHPGGVLPIGVGGPGFAFDNESPRHPVFLSPFRLASRLVTNGEYLAFLTDGGYDRAEFWLPDGWAARQAQGWAAPLYWEREAGEGWQVFTLSGLVDLVESEPVCHVSYYEADAFARWAAVRLPTEAEWEVSAGSVEPLGNFLESEQFHPRPLSVGAPHDTTAPLQMFGDVWEWTASPYVAYPGFRPAEGPRGEYHSRFPCGQMVLRGGSCATPRGFIRPTYRNFFPPDTRWQFSGIRLAQDA